MKQAILTLTYGGFAFTIDSNHLPKKSVSVFLRAAIPEIEKMLNADATCMDVDPIDHDNQMCEEGAKAERERAEDFQKLAADIWSVAATVKKENTDEWMEYFARKMKEFEKRYETLRHGQQQGTTAGGKR